MLEHVLSFSEEVEDELELGGQFYTISISPLYSGNSIRGAVAVLRDMTAQHQLDKLRSDFIANVSHELRTPISMLQGYSEAILDGVTSNEEERNEMVQIIHEESKRMGRLVTDLLDLARMESGHMTLYKDVLLVTPFLERIVNKFMQIARDANVELTFNFPKRIEIFLNADEDRLEQVFTNLIDNAIRHTPDGGHVSLQCRKVYRYDVKSLYLIQDMEYLKTICHLFSSVFIKRIKREREEKAELVSVFQLLKTLSIRMEEQYPLTKGD